MFYPATLMKDDSGYTVTFRDIPEAITCGDSIEDALKNASDALLTAMEFYFEDNREVPYPSKVEKGEYLVELPVSVTAKVFLLNEMLVQHVNNVKLAKLINKKPQEVQRIVDLSHATKIDTIVAALSALGKKLELNLV